MVKLSISISPMESVVPAMNVSSDGVLPIQSIAGAVSQLMYTGMFSFFASRARPQTWSQCSCVITMASRRAASSPIRASLREVSRTLNPASINSRVRSVATKVEFPELPLASAQILTIKCLPD